MEKQIQKMMKNLDLTREEAIKLLQEDKEINRMTSAKQWESDLTESQKQVSKQARGLGTKTTTGKKINRQVKVDTEKRELIELLAATLKTAKAEEIEIENPQKVITFNYKNRKFKIDLSAPRK